MVSGRSGRRTIIIGVCFVCLSVCLFDISLTPLSLAPPFPTAHDRLYYYAQHNEHIEVGKLNNLIVLLEEQFTNMPQDAEGAVKALMDDVVKHYDNTFKHIQHKKSEAKSSDDAEERARWGKVLADGEEGEEEEEEEAEEEEGEEEEGEEERLCKHSESEKPLCSNDIMHNNNTIGETLRKCTFLYPENSS